jgi:hypothetical protein
MQRLKDSNKMLLIFRVKAKRNGQIAQQKELNCKKREQQMRNKHYQELQQEREQK